MMIESIVQGRLKMLKFDLKQLKDLYETVLFEQHAYVIKPLIKNPGKCLLTNQCCCFQALNNINEQSIDTYDLTTLFKITKRRYKFCYIGWELQFKLADQQQEYPELRLFNALSNIDLQIKEECLTLEDQLRFELICQLFDKQYVLLQSLSVLSNLNEILDFVQKQYYEQLYRIVLRTTQHIIDNNLALSNRSNKNLVFNDTDCLRDLFETSYEQIKIVAKNTDLKQHDVKSQDHTSILSEIQFEIPYLFSIEIVWSTIQQILSGVLSEYIDYDNTIDTLLSNSSSTLKLNHNGDAK
ncbi:unnamed protein product [Rotaria sp. Silwood2]|nr:unnamed protein product [Rotaria sp. Silwood2]CAF4403204.1 unnamed protein product [Rotaria sp. Silwood2]